MSKYNIFARRLREAYDEAHNTYRNAHVALINAENALHDAESDRTPEKNSGDKERNIARARLVYHDAKAEFDVARNAWYDFAKSAKEIDRDFRAQIESDFSANPDAIDDRAMELLRSGIVTPADLRTMQRKYNEAGNITMLRIIANFAAESAEKTRSYDRAQEFKAIAAENHDGTSAFISAWERIYSDTMTFSGNRKRNASDEMPGYVLMMNSYMDKPEVIAMFENF